MKGSLITFLLLFFFVSANCQTSRLYHTYWNGSQEIFAYYDSPSGSYVDVAPLSGVRFLNLGESTYDKLANRYFNITDLGITVIDALTGSVTLTIPNSIGANGYNLIEYSASNNAIYACYWTGNEEIFAVYDLNSGLLTRSDTLPGIRHIVVGMSTLDDINGRYFIRSNLGLSMIDVQTGRILRNFPYPNGAQNGLNKFEYDPIGNRIVGLYWTGQQQILTSLDLNTGLYTDIGVLPGVRYLVNLQSSLDKSSSMYAIYTNLGLTIIDILSASIVSTAPAPANSNGAIKGLEFGMPGCFASLSVSRTACDHMNSPSGKYVWRESGVYKDTLVNPEGCDTIVTVDLEMEELNTTVSQAGGMLESHTHEAEYQWFYCSSNHQALQGHNQRLFKPRSKGSYAVQVTKDGCIDTSACFSVELTGNEQLHESIGFKAYPNPSSGEFNIRGPQDRFELKVYDQFGRSVNEYELDRNQLILSAKPGVYFIEIHTEGETDRMRLIKR